MRSYNAQRRELVGVYVFGGVWDKAEMVGEIHGGGRD